MGELMKKNSIEIDNMIFDKYISNEEIKDRLSSLCEELNSYYKNKEPMVIGVLNGCIYFMMDMLDSCTFSYTIDFIKAKSYKGMKSDKLSVDYFLSDADFENKDILIVEDIIDSGKTMKYIYNKIKNCQPNDLKVITLLTKVEKIGKDIEIDWSAFEIENKFVIGYGLDYNNLFRNLKDIYKLNEKEK